MSVQVSVVVPTYKRPHLLAKCLDALLAQDFPARAYEIIVVDDAVCEKTRSVVGEFAGQAQSRLAGKGHRLEAGTFPDIRYVPAFQTQGPAAARNIGWHLARGDVIAFTDDDCLPEPDWLREGLAALREGKDGVSGQVIVPISGTPTDYEKNVSRLASCEFVTANCFYRCQALEKCGGFDERFTMAWREDSDLFFRMMSCSCRLGYAPAARVIHPVRSAPWGVSLKEQRKSMFNALLYKKYSQLYRKHVQRLPPLRYYAILLFALVFFWAVLTRNRPITLLAALLWAAFTLQFAFQRLQGTKHTPSHILEMLFTSVLIPPLSIFWRLFGAFYFKVLFF